MVIYRKGDIKAHRRTKRFLCLKCGCFFEADEGEYNYGTQREHECWIKCPTCNEIVYEL